MITTELPLPAFRDLSVQEIKSVLALSSDFITHIYFERYPEKIPVFHIFESQLILHPKNDWIGTRRRKVIIWFHIYKIKNFRSALIWAEQHKRNGFVEAEKMQSATLV